MSVRRRLLQAVLFCTVALGGALLWHEVPLAATATERALITSKLQSAGIAAPPTYPLHFADQLQRIRQVQDLVLDEAPAMTPIPLGQSREPDALFAAKSGHCADRSRAIEKILRLEGFTVRHVFLLSRHQGESYWQPLVVANRDSHAVTEVLTEKGWLIVDSNDRWLTLDKVGNPVSASQLERHVISNDVWQNPAPNGIYATPVLAIYGLYARHGQFYSPYDAIPDVNLSELAQNFYN
ncbi:MAG: transglutaminase domain-containing protein [Alphaproteobacteria bacterium]|nr:transglutaminase domain-containing protein [Alphaproteobacteria bacterium]